MIWLAGGLGFEPRFSESESDVLPLNYSPMFSKPYIRPQVYFHGLIPVRKARFRLTCNYLAKLFFRCQPILPPPPIPVVKNQPETAIQVALRQRLFYLRRVRREGTDQEQVGTRAAGPSGHLDPGRPSFSAARRIAIWGSIARRTEEFVYFWSSD